MTSRHHLEDATESAALIRAIGNNIPRAMLYQVVREPGGGRRFTYLSDGVAALFGCSPAEGLVDPAAVYGRIHELDRARLRQEEEEANARLTLFTTEARVRLPSGEVRWLAFSSTPRLRPDGTTVWDGVAIDVTDQRRGEEVLRDSERRLRLAAETTGLGLWDWFPPTNEMWWDERSRELLWVAPDAPLDVALFYGRMHPDDREVVRAAAREALDPVTGGGYTVEFRVNGPEGQERWLLGKARVLFEQGQPVRVFGTVLDITDRKTEETRLQRLLEAASEADRRKGEFLAMLSHELRNPLAPIRTSLYVLDRAAPGSDPARKSIAVIARQVSHLTRLVDDLLDMTRISQGKIQLRRERLELGDLVRRTVDDYRAEFETRGVALKVTSGAELFWVSADPVRLAQVIGNLLGNAAKFTPSGGRVEISLRRERDVVAMRVRDTGAGIDPAVLSSLFEPFAQAPQSLDRSQGGLGLGLALVRGLLELHGGSVGVTSEGPGHGAEVTVRLPLAPSAPRREALPVAAQSACGRRRVLIIEDNVDAAATLRDLLELEGHEVQVAFDGPSGIAIARSCCPEVILCDIGLPGMTGYEVARTLRADPSQGGAMLVALTGYALPEEQARAAAAGFAHHVAKPPDLPTLVKLLALAG